MTPVTIVGMGMSPADLTAAQIEVIASAEVLVGGRRHLAHFAHLGIETQVIDRNLSRLVDYVREAMAQRRVVVLASGDPLYFGIGAYLARSLGPDNVTVLPNVSAPAAAFARLKEPWQGVPVVSLHGREGLRELVEALRRHATVAVYTDPERNPAWLAEQLLQNGFGDAALWVLEQLGAPGESVRRLTPREACDLQFSDPNLVVVKQEAMPQAPCAALHLGMAEEAFDHEQGLITKAEIRAVTLAKLKLSAGQVLWDLGAGSGSVAVEASIFVTGGKIFAVEKQPRRISQIEENRRRFQVPNLEVIAAELPQGLDTLPDPDRVFVGGGGRELENILRICALRLRPQGVVVVNTVLIESMQTTLAALEAAGLKTELVQIQVSRGAAMPYGQRLAAENPVWIVRGEAGKETE
jgi:precorrin-6Y C5,15-methyltransferase (decarboxylating)